MVRLFFLLTNKATSCNSCHISWSGRFPAFIAQGDYKGERTYVGMKRGIKTAEIFKADVSFL